VWRLQDGIDLSLNVCVAPRRRPGNQGAGNSRSVLAFDMIVVTVAEEPDVSPRIHSRHAQLLGFFEASALRGALAWERSSDEYPAIGTINIKYRAAGRDSTHHRDLLPRTSPVVELGNLPSQ